VPEASEFLCGDWVWDAALKELRHYERRKKGWADEPDAVERLRPVRSVTWYQWSQAPMQTSTGVPMGSRQSRVVAAYEGGGDLTLEEPDRGCAKTLAEAIAEAFRLPVVEEGSPSGRRGGNVPSRDEMGRLVHRSSKLEVVLDEQAGLIEVAKSKRPFGKTRRSIRLSEIRRVELVSEVAGPTERFTVSLVVGPEEEKLPLAAYEGYEGWAEPQEWREFTQELARSLAVEARLDAEREAAT
jgi:hypothetical protein